MNTIAKILGWAILISLIFIVTLCTLVPLLPVDAVPRIYWSGCLFDFEKRLADYEKSGARIVIVGPSYAKQIGSFDRAHNLALDAAYHPEIAFVIEHYCKNADLVFYVLTSRELSPIKAKTKSMYMVPRRLLILKDAFQKVVLRIPEAQGGNAFEPCSANDIDLLKKAADISRLQMKQGQNLEALIRKIQANPEIDPETLTLEPFELLFQENSNIIFVLHPTLPLQPVNDSSPFGKQLNRWAKANQKIKDLFHSSDLPFIDLTDTEPWEFKDWRHLTENSSKKIPKHLAEAISAYKPRLRHDGDFARDL